MEAVRQLTPCAKFVNSSISAKQYDVVIAGCGPAGLAAAIAARAKGLRVVAIEAGYPSLDKACGEGLMIDSLLAARKLGLQLGSDEGMHFKGIRFLGANHTVQADFPAGPGLAVRRTTLHKKLVEQAESAGIEMHWGMPVCGLEPNALVCRNRRFEARWIIGADGIHSTVRRLAGLDCFAWNRERVGMRQHFALKPWSEYVDVHWAEGCQCYVTPVGPEEVSVAFLARKKQGHFDELLRLFPAVADRVCGARPTSSVRGALTALRGIRRVYKENIVLAGDASGAVDAITGQGIGLALRQARVLADALASENLRQYAKEHAAIMRRPSLMAACLSLLGENKQVREMLFRVFAKHPLSFDRLLAFHVGVKV